jgi:short-subunit dehydrogenase
MFTYQGKTALITGASSGIGEAFARELAQRGMHLIMVARSTDRLQALATELTSTYAIRAEVLSFDLGIEHVAQRIQQEIVQRGLVIDMLINNAGFGLSGRFEDLAPERDHQQMMVNITALVDLTHAFIPQLLARKGAIINIASTAAYQPLPYMAVYGASKAFVLSFSVALSEEYRNRGLRVLVLCPGATETNFFAGVGENAIAMGAKRVPAQVVATGLRALERGQSVVLDGTQNAILAELSKRLPFWLSARIAGQITRPTAS